MKNGEKKLKKIKEKTSRRRKGKGKIRDRRVDL